MKEEKSEEQKKNIDFYNKKDARVSEITADSGA